MVNAYGANAERVLSDWIERVEEPRPSIGGQVVSSPEMRALMILLLALSALFFGRLDIAPEPPLCPHAFEVEADELGSLRMGCADAAGGSAPALRGIARLLDGGRIDLNRAPASLLERLPGIGPVRAAAIVDSRREAPFASLHELERVRGIGPSTRARIEPWLFVAERDVPDRNLTDRNVREESS